MSSPASKKGKIPYLAASVVPMIFYLFIELNPKCDSLWQSFFACQEIRRDNLAPVTLHYSRQWNTRDSVVFPLWRKHKGCALGQYRRSMVITVTQPFSPAELHRWPRTGDEKRHEKQINNNVGCDILLFSWKTLGNAMSACASGRRLLRHVQQKGSPVPNVMECYDPTFQGRMSTFVLLIRFPCLFFRWKGSH